MAVPTTTVEIGFDLLATGDQSGKLILDDPVRGLLDAAGYVLAGETWTDVTQHVRQVNIRRGRSSELDRYSSGQVTVILDNRDRQFDPNNLSGGYYPDVKPRKPVRVTCGTYRQFVGQIEDWQLGFKVDGDYTAAVAGADAFALLAGQQMSGFTASPQTSGERVAAVLDRAEVGWPAAMRDVDTGQQSLQGDEVSHGTNVLQYLQLVEATEPGALFVSRDGMLTFRGRTTAPTVFTGVTFTDTGDGVPFMDIAITYGTELLYNVVNITRAGGNRQTVDGSTGTGYAVSSLTRDNLLHDSDDAALDLAAWWAAVYSEPLVRVKSVTVELLALTQTQQSDVLALDLYNVVSVVFNGVASASKIDAIEHQVTAASHRVTFGFSNALSANNLVLDSPTYGVLDTNRAGF